MKIKWLRATAVPGPHKDPHAAIAPVHQLNHIHEVGGDQKTV